MTADKYGLTHQQFQIFSLLVSNVRLFSRDEIIQHLWPNPDAEPKVPEDVVMTQIHYLRKKIIRDWRIDVRYGRGYQLFPKRKRTDKK